MIDNLFELFKQLIDSPEEAHTEDSVVLAAIALMLEVARSDHGGEQVEHDVIRNVLSDEFKIETESIENLIKVGAGDVEDATDLFQFTQLINAHYSREEKESLIHAMWRVAMADGKVQAIEDHIIRRVAGLIHVAHGDFIRLKLIARNKPT